MAECLFIKADEVVKMLGVSQSEAYRIIKKLNEEAVYKLLLRQGLINFARVGTAVPCLPSMFRYLSH